MDWDKLNDWLEKWADRLVGPFMALLLTGYLTFIIAAVLHSVKG